MVSKSKKKLNGRSFALTILLGVFIAVMVITLFNLIVSYAYEAPTYDDFCKGIYSETSYPSKPYPVTGDSYLGQNCSFNKPLFEQSQACSLEGNTPVYTYDDNGCAVSLKLCSDCSKRYDEAMKVYNRNTFFVFAIIGFVLIVVGLFVRPLLIQIVTLPAGAVLVIEAAVKNFDNKLYVIITFTLLIIAAIYLALKKLR